MKKLTKKYRVRGEGEVEFDISKKACYKFGFYHGQIIDSKYGKASVLGVYNNALWFIWDSETSTALMYDPYYKKEDFIRDGVKLAE